MFQAIARAAVFVAAATLPAIAQAPVSEPFLDSFDFTSPEAVAEDFVAAMSKADFFRAYYLLSPEAKLGTREAVTFGKLDTLLPGVTSMQLPGSIFTDRNTPGDILADGGADQSRVFDDMMLAALTGGHLPFSFAGAAVATVAETGDGVTAEVSAQPPVTLALQQTELGEWRVDTISFAGSGDGRPWGITDATEAVPAVEAPAAPRTYIDQLQFSTPDAAAAAFVQAYADKDYFTAYLTLSPEAKNGPFNQQRPLMMPQFLPGIDVYDLPGTGLFRPDVKRADQLAFDTMYDQGVIFHRLLQNAERQGVLPFDLGQAELGPTETADGIATIPVTTGADPAELTLHLLKLSDGYWRVDQVTWQGSLDWAKPWGGKYEEAAR